ncbi:MAG: TRAP transporter large permease [Oligoflexus sp.]
MELEQLLPLLMFPTLFIFLLSGFPVAFVLAGVSLLFAVIGSSLDLFFWEDLGFIPSRVFGIVSNLTLVAVPLFVLMGMVLEKSGVASELLETISDVFRRYRSSLSFAVVLVGALLAASTGIVGATVVTMGVLSLPTMLQQGYDKRLACGTIAAAGTLGQIIPPSIVLILLGDMMNVDVGDLFAGAMIPGLLLVGVYLLYLAFRSYLDRSKVDTDNDAQAQRQHETVTATRLLKTLLPSGLLVILVLGSILGGLASPTEASGCGALGALIIALLKGRLNFKVLSEIGEKTARTTAMVFWLLLGAQFFGVVFRGLGGDDVIIDSIAAWNLSPYQVLIVFMFLLFVLGFFLDFLEICFIVIPIILPVMIELEFNLLWVAILVAINLQTSFLTPPFGFALFYLKGVAPAEVKTLDIYRGAIPYVGLQIFVLAVLIMFPDIVLWLPRVLFQS